MALAYASLAMLKRYTVGAARSTSMLQVLDSTTLAPNRSVDAGRSANGSAHAGQ